MASDESRVLTGFDVEPDAVAADLRALAGAIEEGDAYIQAVESVEQVAVEDDAEQTLSVTFIPKNTYDGTLRFEYDE
jgi:hypothetical protein